MDYERNDEITVDDTAAVVVSSEKGNRNVKRLEIVIINTSSLGQKVTLAIGEEAQFGKGMTLGPNGSWVSSRDGLNYPTQKHITAIASGANATIAIRERVGDA